MQFPLFVHGRRVFTKNRIGGDLHHSHPDHGGSRLNYHKEEQRWLSEQIAEALEDHDPLTTVPRLTLVTRVKPLTRLVYSVVCRNGCPLATDFRWRKPSPAQVANRPVRVHDRHGLLPQWMFRHHPGTPSWVL